ncbi:hypothetical protein [Gimesia fumaroli]|uniref:Uncharacterized protein n=1 Tax=Gimesia fumaroli TaxID=2527976 RepID=A0A518I8M7_9PLAN|nr:hypothetical protein [Gimesia fumaroli]QDV49437.1 hypothetical protein Enr17x_14550 [Gimesia fumaroli]
MSLQRKELQDTREELKLTREAHQKNCGIMDEQLQILKVNSRIEQAEYRKSMLPHFIQKEITEQKRAGDTVLWYWKYENAGRDIKDAIFMRYGEEIFFETPRFHKMTGEGNQGILSFWTKGELNGEYQCTLNFKSMDDQCWNLIFYMNFRGGEFKSIFFRPAKEDWKQEEITEKLLSDMQNPNH